MKTNLEILRAIPLQISTPAAWCQLVLENIGEFLADHASCERKAHAAAMMLVNRYPEYTELQDRMIALAREELLHFQQVVGLLRQRGIPLGPDAVDPYVKELMVFVRHPKDQHLLDRLVVAAIIEARSCERLFLAADALPAGDLKFFYEAFAREESAHFPLFIETAKLYYPGSTVETRLAALLTEEANILPRLPLRATVH